LPNREKLYTPVQGKAYALFAVDDDCEGYDAEIKRWAEVFLRRRPDGKRLWGLIQTVGEKPLLLGTETTGAAGKLRQFVREPLRQSLSIYTQSVSNHLKSLPRAGRSDRTLATPEERYHL